MMLPAFACPWCAAPQCPHISVLSSEEHGTAIDSARGMRSFDVRHRCCDGQSTHNHVLCTSKSITGMVQRGVLMEAAAVLFWRDRHFSDPPWSRLVGSILSAPVEIAGGPEARQGRLGIEWGIFAGIGVSVISRCAQRTRLGTKREFEQMALLYGRMR